MLFINCQIFAFDEKHIDENGSKPHFLQSEFRKMVMNMDNLIGDEWIIFCQIINFVIIKILCYTVLTLPIAITSCAVLLSVPAMLEPLHV